MAGAVRVIGILLFLCFWILMFAKVFRTKLGKAKTVKTEVVDKYIDNAVSRCPGTFQQKRYIVVFAAQNKRLAFAVSEFSYASYKIKEKGTLQYKGDQIISFQ